MKKIFIVLFLACLISNAGFAQKDLNPGTYAYITIENPDNFARKNSPVVIPVTDITAKFKKYNKQRIGIFDGSKEIESQFDDLNNDGIADEVAFLVDLAPKAKVKLMVRMLPPNFEIPNFKKEVFAELMKKDKVDGADHFTMVTEASSDKDDMYNKMQHHGVAFESAEIAYRLYFDKKQTVDVYGKITPKLEIAETQWYPKDEQLAKGYGDDVLKVNESVGVGTVKGWDGSKATHVEVMSKRTQRIVATGNLRNVVEIEVQGWQYAGKTFNVKMRYIQYARHRDVEAQVLFDKDFKDSITLCTGVQRMPEEKFHTDKTNLVGIWGKDFPVNDSIKFGKQTIGLGVVIPTQYAKQQVDDKLNHLVLLQNNGQPFIRFYLTAAAMKEKKGYKNADVFFQYLEDWKKEMLSPVVVTITEK